jgi:hypothetical protein
LPNLIFERCDCSVFIGHFQHKVNVFSGCEPCLACAMLQRDLTHFTTATCLAAVRSFRQFPRWFADIIGNLAYQ